LQPVAHRMTATATATTTATVTATTTAMLRVLSLKMVPAVTSRPTGKRGSTLPHPVLKQTVAHVSPSHRFSYFDLEFVALARCSTDPLNKSICFHSLELIFYGTVANKDANSEIVVEGSIL